MLPDIKRRNQQRNETPTVPNHSIHGRFDVFDRCICKGQQSALGGDPRFCTSRRTQLKSGKYDVKWQGAGPEIQVSFVHDGKTVATVPGTLKTNDPHVTEDDIVTDTTDATTKTLKEIDFAHNKESVVFEQSGM